MRISFWKRPEPVSDPGLDPETLRERYIADGRRVAEKLSKDDNVLAVGLPGPFDAERVQLSSDLHMVVVVGRALHAYYHHMLPSFSPVKRRLEIACLSLHHLNSIIGNGYSGWDDVYDLHKLKDAIILCDKKGFLNSLPGKIEGLRPGPIFIGRQVTLLRRQLDHIYTVLHHGRYRETHIAACKYLVICIKLLLVAGRHETFSKLSFLHKSLLNISRQMVADNPWRLYSLDNIDKEKGADVLFKTDTLLKNLFQRKIA